MFRFGLVINMCGFIMLFVLMVFFNVILVKLGVFILCIVVKFVFNVVLVCLMLVIVVWGSDIFKCLYLCWVVLLVKCMCIFINLGISVVLFKLICFVLFGIVRFLRWLDVVIILFVIIIVVCLMIFLLVMFIMWFVVIIVVFVKIVVE